MGGLLEVELPGPPHQHDEGQGDHHRAAGREECVEAEPAGNAGQEDQQVA